MNKIKKASLGLALTAMTFAPMSGIVANAQTRPYGRQTSVRYSDAQIEAILRRLENTSDRFKQALDTALDRSRVYDGTRAEDDINRLAADFEESTDRLRDNFNNRRAVNSDVQAVFDRAIFIDNFMQRNALTPRAQRTWQNVRAELNQLGTAYSVAYRSYGSYTPGQVATQPGYNQPGYNQPGYNQPGYGDARLTGTYQLDTRSSDDPRRQADQATRVLRVSTVERQRIFDELVTRLDSPDQIAIDRRGNQFSIASTRGAQVNITANNREEFERYPDGRSARVRASVAADRLTIASTGNRATDYTVTFEPLNNNQLRVTRTIYHQSLTQPVTVQSLYNKTAQVANLDLYRNSNTSANTGYYPSYPRTTSTTVTGGFVVPDGTTMVAVLENDVSTRTSSDGDRFTMSVRDASNRVYDGAILEGRLTDLSRSGRVTGRASLTFAFDQIRLRDGRSFRFAGFVDNIRTTNGEDIRIDNEGTVRDDNNQTTRTAQRAGIGAGIGALIGAIAGGGKGAAIGAAIGAGAGAGSVYVQGRDDLELQRGTELTVRASSPR